MPPTTTPRRSRTATGLSPIGRHAVPECGANMRDISTSLTARLRASGSICFSPRIRWHRRLRLSTAGIGRSTQSKPIAEALAAWAESTERQLSRKSELALAFRYMRARWTALVRCFDDGRLALDNNPAERALRCVATRRSLCPPSSSLWKHWNLIFGLGAIRATFSPERGRDPLVLQVAGADLVRSAGHHLLGREDTILNQAAYVVIGDTEFAGGLRHCQPFACLLGRTVSMNAVHPAHRTDTVRSPGLPLTRWHSHPVQRRGNILVRPSGRHGPHHGEGVVGGPAAVLAGLRLADPQLRVLATAPMDR